MPLVTLTCTHQFYPPDGHPDDVFTAREQEWVVRFAQSLPRQLVNNRDVLDLEGSMPEEGVQVDIRRFHFRAVNAVDLWICVNLSDEFRDRSRRLDIRAALLEIVQEALKEAACVGIYPSWALDVFFGPSHGAISTPDGTKILESW